MRNNFQENLPLSLTWLGPEFVDMPTSHHAVAKGMLVPCCLNLYCLELRGPDESNSIYPIKIRSLDF